MSKPLTYADAGVDIDKANDFVRVIKKIAKQTHKSGVIGEIGGFGGLFSLHAGNYEGLPPRPGQRQAGSPPRPGKFHMAHGGPKAQNDLKGGVQWPS